MEFSADLIGKRVECYFNLHKHCFSVRYRGKIVLHADEVHLGNATFKVSESGRQRVLKEKRKNVHAYVCGILLPLASTLYNNEAYYNPYLTDSFVNKQTGNKLVKADFVTLTNKKIYYKEIV